MTTTPPAADEPVTVLVRRRVRAGHQRAFEAWTAETTALCARYAGFLGANVIAPAPGAEHGMYTAIFRFDNYAHMQAWEASEDHRAALARAAAFTEGAVQRQTLSGLESWFAPPGAAGPPRWKTLIVLCAASYPVSSVLGVMTRPLLRGLPPWLAMVIVLPLTLAVVSYVVLPWLTPLLSGWLNAPGAGERDG